jgi:hypothetical protein
MAEATTESLDCQETDSEPFKTIQHSDGKRKERLVMITALDSKQIVMILFSQFTRYVAARESFDPKAVPEVAVGKLHVMS